MKRKILVPMFASVMALSMNTVANADQVENNNENDKNKLAPSYSKHGQLNYTAKIQRLFILQLIKFRNYFFFWPCIV